MNGRFVHPFTGFVAVLMLLAVVALGTTPPQTVQASEPSTAQSLEMSADSVMDLQQCAPYTMHAAASFQGEIFPGATAEQLYAMPPQALCCGWIHFCDYYQCYYYEECWWC